MITFTIGNQKFGLIFHHGLEPARQRFRDMGQQFPPLPPAITKRQLAILTQPSTQLRYTTCYIAKLSEKIQSAQDVEDNLQEAVIYTGKARVHWRDEMVNEDIPKIMFHGLRKNFSRPIGREEAIKDCLKRVTSEFGRSAEDIAFRRAVWKAYYGRSDKAYEQYILDCILSTEKKSSDTAEKVATDCGCKEPCESCECHEEGFEKVCGDNCGCGTNETEETKETEGTPSAHESISNALRELVESP